MMLIFLNLSLPVEKFDTIRLNMIKRSNPTNLS